MKFAFRKTATHCITLFFRDEQAFSRAAAGYSHVIRDRDVMVNMSALQDHFNREAMNQPQTKPITPDSGNPKDVVLARSRATKTHTTSNTIP